jgi:Transmembrane secretion effector
MGVMSKPTPLRRNRDFVLLQAGQLLSAFGSNMSRIAYPLLTLAVTHSPAKAGYVGGVQFAPYLIFGLIAGVAADRFERRRLMIVSETVAAATLATLAASVLAHETRFWLILAVAFADGTAGVFTMAAQRGAFRAVVPLAQLPAAASVAQARAAAVRLAAPPVGGALFAVGRALPFVADAVSYAFSTISALLMRTRFQEERERDPAPLRRQFAEGVSFYAQIPFLRTTMAMISVSNFTVAGVQLAVIVLAQRQGLSSTAIGGFVALVGGSTLIGSLATPLVRRVLPMRAILLSEFWAAFGYIAFLVRPSVYVLAGVFAAQAFCFPNTDSAITAYNYALIPDRLLGRALSVGDTLRIVGAPLGPLVAGLLLDAVSPRTTIAVLMAATLAVTVPGTLSASIRDTPPLDELTTSPA